MAFFKAIVTLTPAESKRLIAKAVACMPEVKRALQSGKVVIGNGSTTAYVVEEILGQEIEKWRFPSGVVTGGVQCQTPEGRLAPYLLDKGSLVSKPEGMPVYQFVTEFMADFSPEDVFIKSANALDPAGQVGFLLADKYAGTLGVVYPIIAARGSHFIVPVGLEKMVSSVTAAAKAAPGIFGAKYSFGRGCGYFTLSHGRVITEVEALKILTGVAATHIASGGIGGSEGAVTLAAEGLEQQIDGMGKLVSEIKGEKRLRGWKNRCSDCWFAQSCSSRV